jgi:hypothetical protein
MYEDIERFENTTVTEAFFVWVLSYALMSMDFMSSQSVTEEIIFFGGI